MISLFIIEHMEPVLSRWMWIEYKHASRIVGKESLWITNVKDREERRILEDIAARVFEESVSEINIPSKKVIVLDPSASVTLKPGDFGESVSVVVGGIMGDYPPQGRTRKLASKLISAEVRTLGPYQFPIDSAIYVALEVSKGRRLDEIPIIDKLEVKVSEGHTILLPYAYPIVDGKPLISDEEIEYLKKDVEDDEARAIREGRVRSVSEER
ncbi:MAG: hypothetical protein DRJ41_04585 [Thermoprotei archaeon]|nr:MAG: hypothetical protein DRJ41_04585 [Thermoprotei archaeon]